MPLNEPIIDSLFYALIGIETAMKSHYACFEAALETQRSIIERMQILSQRYNILLKSIPSRQMYPKESCHNVEDDIKADFHGKAYLLNESNTMLQSSLSDMRTKYCALQTTMEKMNKTEVSSLQAADNTRPSAAYFIEQFSDFLKFYTKHQSKMNCYLNLLTPGNVRALTSYKKLLELDSDFKDHFDKSLAYCRCLHNKPKT